MIANPNDGNSPQVEVATPTISVSAGGLITASTQQGKGYVPGGSKSATQQLPTQGAKTVTPGTSAQTAVTSGRYTTGTVQVAGDANLKPENIAEGVSIFGVTGSFAGGGAENVTVSFTQYNIFLIGISIYYVSNNELKSQAVQSLSNPISVQKNSLLFINDSSFSLDSGNAQLVSGGNSGRSPYTLFFVEGDFTIDVMF